MRAVILGFAQHGKDKLCEYLPYRYQSSSLFALERFLFDRLAPKYDYQTLGQAYRDRFNHRAEWYDEIKLYNTPNRARLVGEVFEENDIYCGLRCREEYYAARSQRLFDVAIWVDRSQFEPPEPATSISLTEEDADLVLDNNGSLEDLRRLAGQVATNIDAIDRLHSGVPKPLGVIIESLTQIDGVAVSGAGRL